MVLMFSRIVRAAGGTVYALGASSRMIDLADAAGFIRLFAHTPPEGGEQIRLLDLKDFSEYMSPTPRIDAYPTHRHGNLVLRKGLPIPFGATGVMGGINFSVYSRHATACTLVLFKPGKEQPFAEIPFPAEFRIGDVFAMIVFDLDPYATEYGFRMDGPGVPEEGHRFDRSKVLLDPAARAISGPGIWGFGPDRKQPYPYRSRIQPEDFDWGDDRPLGLPFHDLIIYEMHVRGFTRSPSSGVKHPGTFVGLREKIPYLKELGVNCRTSAGLRIRRDRVGSEEPAHGRAVMELLGIQHCQLLRSQGGICRHGRSRSTSGRIQDLDQGTSPERHRDYSGRGV
jgi:hypothetical protein